MSSLKVILKISATDKKIKILELDVGDSVTLGRSSKSDIKLDDDQLSSTHLKITLKNQGMVVEDLNSKNGIFLNKIRIEKSEMFMGDELKIGKTKISFDSTKMDAFSRDMLAFPGGERERVAKDLKVDFTGARIQNQLTSIRNNYGANKNIMNDRPEHFQRKEVETRKKASSYIRLSKEQIKSQNKIRASFASLFDLIFVISLLAVPIAAMNYFIGNGGIDLPGISLEVSFLKQEKALFMGVGEILLIGLFFMLNFRVLKFSFGEKIAGIQNKYTKQ